MKPGEHIVLLTNYSIITSEQMFCRCEQNVNQSTQGQKRLLTEKIHTVPNRREGRNFYWQLFLSSIPVKEEEMFSRNYNVWIEV